MSLFGRKKGEEPAAPPKPGEPSGGAVVTPEPEKAQRFFERARTVGETGNHEYAMQLWLGGLRLDISSMSGLEGFLNAAANFMASGSGKLSRDLVKAVDGKSDVEKYLQALLAWAVKIADASLAVRAVEAASKLELAEQTHYLGDFALKLARNKPKKDVLTRLMEALARVQAFDLAVRAGDAACELDRSDGVLAAQVRNMSAAATMTRGGFEGPGKEGGFRQNIRDAEKQRQLEEGERIVKTEETVDRLVADAEAEHQRRPDDIPTAQTLAKRLVERGRPEDEQRAYKMYAKLFEETKQFRFRQEAGRIRIRQARRSLAQYEQRAEANPGDEKARADLAAAQRKFTEMEIGEYIAAAEAYPTDLSIRFELGKRFFTLGDYDRAIGLLQESKGDARFRVASLDYLGRAFLSMSWNDESIATFRQALQSHPTHSDETGLAIRYGLMQALAAKASGERDLSSAEEAEKLASSIAIEQFSYRDIRARREALKSLVAELRKGG